MNQEPAQVVRGISMEKPGMTSGITACVLAAIGIPFSGIIFIPIAIIVAIIGTVIATINKNNFAIGVNILAWILIIIGFLVSPFLWGIVIGFFEISSVLEFFRF